MQKIWRPVSALIFALSCSAHGLSTPDCSRPPYGYEVEFGREGHSNVAFSHTFREPSVRDGLVQKSDSYEPMPEEELAPVRIYQARVDPTAATDYHLQAHRSRYFNEFNESERSRLVQGEETFFYYPERDWVPAFLRELPTVKIWCGRKFLSHETYWVWDPEDLFAPPLAFKFSRSYEKTVVNADWAGTEISAVTTAQSIAKTIATNDYIESAIREGGRRPSFAYYPERFAASLEKATESFAFIARGLTPFPNLSPRRYDKSVLATAVGADLFSIAARRAKMKRQAWLKRELIPRLARVVHESLIYYGFWPEFHGQNIEIWIDRITGELVELTIKDAADILVAPLPHILNFESGVDVGFLGTVGANVMNQADSRSGLPHGLFESTLAYLTDAIFSLSPDPDQVSELLFTFSEELLSIHSKALEAPKLDRKTRRFFSLAGAPTPEFTAEGQTGKDLRSLRRLWRADDLESWRRRRLGAARTLVGSLLEDIYWEMTWKCAGYAVHFGHAGTDPKLLKEIFQRQLAKGLIYYTAPHESGTLLNYIGGWDSPDIFFIRFQKVILAYALMTGGSDHETFAPIAFAHDWSESDEVRLVAHGAFATKRSPCTDLMRIAADR